MSLDGRVRLRVVLPLFFLVGAGALIVETTWMRWLRALMGATAPAVSAALVAVTLGQFVGALLGARASARSSNPLRAFGMLQLVAVIFALLVEPSLEVATRLVDATGSSSIGWLTVARLVASVGATLPASAAIGAAFPLLVSASSRDTGELGPRGTALYSADLAGAAVGAGLTAFWLPALLGVRGGYSVGVAALSVAAIASFVIARDRDATPTAQATDASAAWPKLETALVSFGSGFGVFAAQLLLHQAFGRVLDQSTFALGAVLVATLLSLAAGAMLVSLTQRRVSPDALVAGAAMSAAAGFLLFPTLFSKATGSLAYLVSADESATYVPRVLLLCALTSGPALVAAAAVLPALFVRAGRDAEGDGRAAGHIAGGLLAANTVGAMTGALAAPYLLLPRLHLWPSFAVLGALYAVIGVAAAKRLQGKVAIAAVLGVVCVLAQPWTRAPLRLHAGEELLSTEVSAAGLVAVIEREGELLIQTDNHYALGGSADAVHQERQGHLPLLLHPAPRRVAFIGTATGSSAGVAFDHGVEELVAVEIMPGVTDAATRFFGRWNSEVYADARTSVVADDVRSFLRRGTDRFDVIVADLFVPWRSETGSLYTMEHFTRAKERLAPGGSFCQWLPLYQLGPSELESILATYLRVFPEAEVYRGDFFGAHAIIALIGGDPQAAAGTAIEARQKRLIVRGVDDRWVTHRLGPSALHVGPLSALAGELEKVPLNTENHPVVEFAAARNPARHSGRTDWTAAGDPFLRQSGIIRRSEDWRSSRVALDAQRASAGGYFLQSASTYWGAGRSDDAARALSEAARLLPRELLADAPPDRTAADVWHTGP